MRYEDMENVLFPAYDMWEQDFFSDKEFSKLKTMKWQKSY